MEERLSAAGGELLASIRAGVATVTLNRPAAHNAISFGMLEGLAAWLEAWRGDERIRSILLRGAGDRAFCAGGDVRAIHEDMTGPGGGHHRFFEVEYELDYRIHTYPKPIAAYLDGIVMGGGMGISMGAALRIVGPKTRMAMPETAIGLFPDVGGSWFLSRLPGKLGVYLGLAGPTIRAADAVYCGLADLDVGPPAPSELEHLRPAIDRHFAHGSVEEILDSLEREPRPERRDWATRTAALLRRRSPTMLKVTLEQLRRGAAMPLDDCFRMELNLIHGCFDHGDMVEGIRAVIVDKDHNPRWHPPALESVRREDVEAFFRPRWSAADHPLHHLRPPRNP